MSLVRDTAPWAAFLAAWRRHHGATPVTVRELLILPEAIALVAAHAGQHQRLVSLGRMLGADGGRDVRRVRWPRSWQRKNGSHYSPATWALTENDSAHDRLDEEVRTI
jgi:hypothetical protein